jgi:predicted phosphodiesterase
VRFLILSDLHANWYALEAVLSAAQGKYDQVVCCGDLVGYNPHPAQVIDWTKTHSSATIRGNHDKVVAGIEDLDWFNEVAQAAATWTIGQLSEADLAYLRELPSGPCQLDHFHMWHGSPGDEDEYVSATREAAPFFAHFDLPLAFFGHTHLQGGFFSKRGRVAPLPRVNYGEPDRIVELEPDTLYMVNPGSVGQPRDGDPRAAYVLFDSDQKLVTFCRVEYPVHKTVAEMTKAGLPDVLGLRLFHGF